MSSTIALGRKEDKRRLRALTRCAAHPDDCPELAYVLFDGTHAYATDRRVLAVLHHPVELPAERVVVPARHLSDAIGLSRGKELLRLRFDEDGLVALYGEDEIEGLEVPRAQVEFSIPYGDPVDYPDTMRLRRLLDGVTEDGEVQVAELVTRLGLDVENLSRLAALADAGESTPLVTLHPRKQDGATGLVEVRDVVEEVRLGVMSRIGTFTEEDL